MSAIRLRIDDVVARDLALRLNADGYRKSGRTFYRVVADHTALDDRERAAGHLRTAIERLPRGRVRFAEWGKKHGLIT